MDLSPRLGLPYMASQQAQKQLTYNEAIRGLDTLVQLSAKSRTTTAPPGSPVTGDTYIVAPSATGAWTGKDGKIASFVDGGWDFRTPANGWLAYIVDTAQIAICQSGAWSPLVTNGGASVSKFGINATADLTTRLALAADASLFSHDGTSHRLKINKAAAGDTASLLFQTGFSGRAEFGLTGDDDFHLKVSSNGSSWIDALAVARSSGLVTLPAGQLAFPATQNPSSSPNVLDDYEEGTYTPSLTLGGGSTGITYVARSGRYTKIGRLVTVTFSFALSAKGASTGDAALAGLPFAAAIYSNGSVGFYHAMASLGGTPLLQVNTGTSSVTLYNPGATGAVALTHANVTDTTQLYGSITYEA